MTDITDAAVVAHTNDVGRPLSNVLTGLIPYLRIERTRWLDQIEPLVNPHAESDLLADGSGPAGDGRVQLSKSDLVKFWGQVSLIIDLSDGQDVVQTAPGELAYEDMIKPHVKPKFPI